MSNYKPKLLKFAAYDDPVLHQKTEPVVFPLSIEDQHLIADMIFSIQPQQLKKANAAWEVPAGMAANQWGVAKSIFLFCPYGNTEDLKVIINPTYEPIPTLAIIAPSEVCEWEGCFSVPLATGNIKRSNKIKITYQNEQGAVIHNVLAGYNARVWQHETDHINGHLYDDPRTGKCVEKRTFNNLKEVDDFYEDLRDQRKKKV